MNAPVRDELRDFHRFIGEKVDNGGVSLSPEEALDEWRALNPAFDALAEKRLTNCCRSAICALFFAFSACSRSRACVDAVIKSS